MDKKVQEDQSKQKTCEKIDKSLQGEETRRGDVNDIPFSQGLSVSSSVSVSVTLLLLFYSFDLASPHIIYLSVSMPDLLLILLYEILNMYILIEWTRRMDALNKIMFIILYYMIWIL